MLNIVSYNPQGGPMYVGKCILSMSACSWYNNEKSIGLANLNRDLFVSQHPIVGPNVPRQAQVIRSFCALRRYL